MKTSLRALFLFGLFAYCSPKLAAQAPAGGSVAFVAEVQPTGGQNEPVRVMPFFLLRKSLDEIRKDAVQAEAPKGMDVFIDGLSVSPELKTWMKAQHRVDLAGGDFTKLLTADDVVDIPEFFTAYKVQNASALNVEVPEPKKKKGDKPEDAEKYQLKLVQYRLDLKRYIRANMDSLAGLDAALADQNPGREFAQLEKDQEGKIQADVLKLVQTQYLASKTNSDLQGRGEFSDLAPGEYWLTNLNSPALAGDLRLSWNVSVQVRPGQTARVELSNFNAADAPGTSSR